jgi:hypothetical protein
MWFIALPPPPTPITFITFDWFFGKSNEILPNLSCSSFYLVLIFIIIFDFISYLGQKGKKTIFFITSKLLALSKKLNLVYITIKEISLYPVYSRVVFLCSDPLSSSLFSITGF